MKKKQTKQEPVKPDEVTISVPNEAVDILVDVAELYRKHRDTYPGLMTTLTIHIKQLKKVIKENQKKSSAR
jgi:hypothetical protein